MSERFFITLNAHLEMDPPSNEALLLLLGVLLIALLINSYTSNGSGPSRKPATSSRDGDSAIDRSSTDELMNKAKAEERPGLATG